MNQIEITGPLTNVSVFLGDPFLPDREQLSEGAFYRDGEPVTQTDAEWERSYADELVSTGQRAQRFLDAGWRISYSEGARATLAQTDQSWQQIEQAAEELGVAEPYITGYLADGHMFMVRDGEASVLG
jgi:hypothetical protein